MPPRSIRRTACAKFERAGPIFLTAALAGILLGPRDGLAADWPQELFNPSPTAEDLVLPMPCGGAMAFRKVALPQAGPLDDYAITLGGTDEDYAYAENVYRTFLAGSFPEGASGRFYLLGKYEVTRLQYAALGEKCPEPSMDGRLPQVQVSWFDAVQFADRYSRWLRQNALEKLPKDGPEPGFVRLPTDVEWEFAARGGLAVSPADFRERTFPMTEPTGRYAWFGGPRSANGKAQMVGLLRPNPLGLHDMLGNVDEVVLEPFRLNRLDRLHGQAGGFSIRGGNFHTPEQDLRSAYRKEVPYYKGAEPTRSGTTGLRVAVTGPVLTSRDRLHSIREAWSALGTPRPAAAAVSASEKPLSDPVAEVGALAELADAPPLKGRLLALQKQLKEIQLQLRSSVQQQEDKQRLAARAALRLGGFLCQLLSTDAEAVDRLVEVIENRRKAFGDGDPSLKAYEEQRQEEEAILAGNLQYYAETVISSSDIYDDSVLSEQMKVLEADLKLKGLDRVARFAATYTRDVSRYRSDSKVSRAAWLQNCKSTR